MRVRVYVAGPFSADNVMDVLRNIRDGIGVSAGLLDAGLAPFCPWLDYQYVVSGQRDIPKEAFYEMSEAWLRVADALYVIGDYASSQGTLKEIELAKSLGIPVFYGLTELLTWGVFEHGGLR